MLEPGSNTNLGSALAASKGIVRRASNKSDQNRDPNRDNKGDNLWCTHCKKSRHTRENCFKLHSEEQVLNRIGIRETNQISPAKTWKLNQMQTLEKTMSEASIMRRLRTCEASLRRSLRGLAHSLNQVSVLFPIPLKLKI